MPAVLKKKPNCLALYLGGLDSAEFKDAKAKAKDITGRRWNPDDKSWEYPDDIDTALEIVHTIQPELDAEVRELVKGAQSKIADELVTRLPEDADLRVPWGPELFPFQRAGVEYMVQHPHVILADEMGLGKTVEAITTIEETGTAGPTLVVCPSMVRGVWASELTYGPLRDGKPVFKNWVERDWAIIDGDRERREAALRDALSAPGPASRYIIVNWEKLRLMPALAEVEWAAVVADEAHRAKNRKAAQTKALWKLTGPLQIAASGTPMMNSPDELWSILKWLRPEQYTSYWAFDAQYVEGYKGFKGHKVVTGVRNPDALRFELADKLVRRTKIQVKEEIGYVGKLPPIVQEVELHPKQQRAYNAAEDALWLDVVEAMKEASNGTGNKQRDIVAALQSGDAQALGLLIPNAAARLVRLRQIATSPALIPESDADDVSSKLDACQERINDNAGKQFVVYTWYKGSSELLAARLRRQKPAVDCETLHGDVPQGARQQIVDDFQNGDTQVLIATIATGGTGITLIAADTCIFIEEDWTPAMNQQAIDRLDRIGQKSLVTIVKVRASDTIDTKRIAPTNRLKEMMSGAILGVDPQGQEATT